MSRERGILIVQAYKQAGSKSDKGGWEGGLIAGKREWGKESGRKRDKIPCDFFGEEGDEMYSRPRAVCAKQYNYISSTSSRVSASTMSNPTCSIIK